MNVGFVGLGVMGSAMSSHLLAAGFAVVGYDVDQRRLTEHGRRGGLAASSVDEVCRRSDLVVTSLPSEAAFTEVVQDLTGDVTVVETSTLSLEAKLAARRRLGPRLLDCPLSGTGAQARDKDLVVFVSGDDAEAKQRLGGVLDAFARSWHDVGEFGNGTRMKIVANHLVTIHNLASAEALLLARRAGLDPELALRVLVDGAGTSRMLEVRGPAMVAGEYEPAAMRVELFGKDLDIIGSFAQAVGSPTPLFSASTPFYDAALAQGRGQQDTACLYAVLDTADPK
ncbi:MAG: NAD(P)-dependent oxidoreductase [Pseudonocardia sp.]|nr:NAD(P)-dependent oxidoreductase [Pseudonocardia sp.]MBO0872965.1 NAD(P)-dependent oxidoreductase [Pseudonocardia sp.]